MKNKNEILNKLKKNYFKIPNKIFEVNLSATAIAMYCYLAKNREDFNPSVSTIAKSLKLSKTTTIKYLKELQNRNIINQYEAGAERRVSKYEFIKGNDWK